MMKRALDLPLAVTLRAMCSIVGSSGFVGAPAEKAMHCNMGRGARLRTWCARKDHRQRGRCRARLEHRFYHGHVDRIVPPEPLVGRHHLQTGV